MVQLWGKQVVEKKPVNKAAKKGKDTKAIMRKETVKQKVRKSIRQEHMVITVLSVQIEKTTYRFSKGQKQN